MFQSLSRVADHSAPPARSTTGASSKSFNPSVGLPIIRPPTVELVSGKVLDVSIPQSGCRSFGPI